MLIKPPSKKEVVIATLFLCTSFLLLTGCATANPQEELVVAVTADINERREDLEYGTVLFCNEGDCYHSGIVEGEHNTVGLPIPDEGEFRYVVGTIHSHPLSQNEDAGIAKVLNEANKSPSGQDWFGNFLHFTRPDNRGPFTIYIIGPDDVVRAYPIP